MQAYESQLNGDLVDSDDELLQSIPLCINSEQRVASEEYPTLEEILEVIKSLSKDSTPGPDGYNGQFYYSC